MDILKAAQAVEQYVIDCRRHIHRHPELSDHEDNTVAFIDEELTKMGIPHVVVPHGGVIGFVDGPKEGKTVLLRADIDALPMQESKENAKQPKEVVSEVDGVAHTCGHDVHTAMLLGAAKILSEHKEEIEGRALIFFERGEEGTGNIYYMIKYLQENNIHVDGCWAIHVHANVEAGKMVLLSGPTLAGALGFDVTIHGKGGHGARPDLSRNPIDCFAAIHTAINQIRIRSINAFHPCTYTVCLVDGGTSTNIIPDKVSFSGTCRYFDEQDAMKFRGELERIVRSICTVYHCEPEFHKLSMPGLPVLNNAECAELGKEAIAKAVGAQYLTDYEPKMGSESFSQLSVYYPSVFAFMGTANEANGQTADTHNPKFDPDESSFKIGVASTVAYALAFLKDNRPINFTPFEGTIDDLANKLGR